MRRIPGPTRILTKSIISLGEGLSQSDLDLLTMIYVGGMLISSSIGALMNDMYTVDAQSIHTGEQTRDRGIIIGLLYSKWQGIHQARNK